jgi:hypothetical protein
LTVLPQPLEGLNPEPTLHGTQPFKGCVFL